MLIPALVDAVFASTFTLGQAALCYTSPLFLIGLRMVLAGLLLLGYCFIKKDLIRRVSFLFVGSLVLLHIYIPYTTEFWGLQYVGSAKAALIFSLTPFITALFERLFFKFSLTPVKFIGMLIGFLGLLPSLSGMNASDATAIISLPELAIIVSAITSSLGWLLIKHGVQQGVSVLWMNGLSMTLAGLCSFITSAFFEHWHPLPTVHLGYTFLYASLLIVVGNFLYYNVYGYLLKRYSATFLSFFGFTIPLFAALYEWLFFGHVVHWTFFVTLSATVIGLYIFYKEELKRG